MERLGTTPLLHHSLPHQWGQTLRRSHPATSACRTVRLKKPTFDPKNPVIRTRQCGHSPLPHHSRLPRHTAAISPSALIIIATSCGNILYTRSYTVRSEFIGPRAYWPHPRPQPRHSTSPTSPTSSPSCNPPCASSFHFHSSFNHHHHWCHFAYTHSGMDLALVCHYIKSIS